MFKPILLLVLKWKKSSNLHQAWQIQTFPTILQSISSVKIKQNFDEFRVFQSILATKFYAKEKQF